MVWLKVEDGFYDHPKVLGIPRGARRRNAIALWVLAGSWASRHLTDGFVPVEQVAELGGTPGAAADLVAVRLWLDLDGGYQFHDWHAYQPTRAEVIAGRAAARERKRRQRAAGHPPD